MSIHDLKPLEADAVVSDSCLLDDLGAAPNLQHLADLRMVLVGVLGQYLVFGRSARHD